MVKISMLVKEYINYCTGRGKYKYFWKDIKSTEIWSTLSRFLMYAFCILNIMKDNKFGAVILFITSLIILSMNFFSFIVTYLSKEEVDIIEKDFEELMRIENNERKKKKDN